MVSSSDIFQRAELLLGDAAMTQIASKRVILFGVGGVGSWCAETLVRSGIRHLTIVDSDVVVPSNINRQLMATTATLGQPKVQVLRDRLLSINPEADITAIVNRYNTGSADSFNLAKYDYIIDAIDSLNDKALLINNVTRLQEAQLFSSMGAARKFDPTRIRVAEFWKINGDPLARTLRHKFKQTGIYPERKFLCVYSDEILPNAHEDADHANGSLAHITAIFGNMLAALVLRHICQSNL